MQFKITHFDEILNLMNFHKTPLSVAIEKQNIEIIQLLLKSDKIDVNLKSIYIIFY